MKKALNITKWFVFVGSSIAIGLYPLIYAGGELSPLLRTKAAELLANNFYMLMFYTHIGFGGIALLIGWIQFSKKIRRKYMNAHRLIGKIYIVSVLLSGTSGLYIAMHATGGWSPMLGFTSMDIFWTTTTFLGYTTIRKGKIEAHKKWMIYSYAATFAAVTFRIWLPILMTTLGSFFTAYQIVPWLSWIPNVIVAYFIVRYQQKRKASPQLSTT
jgi:uncharacterized membrane protein